MDKEIKKQTGSSDRDAAFVRAVQGGDMAAFDQLVLKHKDKLFNMVFWFLGDYQEANDCAQEILDFRTLGKFLLDFLYAGSRNGFLSLDDGPNRSFDQLVFGWGEYIHEGIDNITYLRLSVYSVITHEDT